MIAVSRLCAVALVFVAMSLTASPAWPAMELSQPGAPAQSNENAGPSRAGASDLPEITAPRGRGAGPLRADVDADGIFDSLEVRLDQAEPGVQFDVIVVFDRPGPVARSRAAVGQFAVSREFSLVNGFQASMTAAQIRALSAVSGVMRIQENATVTAFDTYGNDDTGATEAGTFNDSSGNPVDGSGVTVCVVDTGINAAHEQFTDKVVGFADFVNGQAGAYDDQGHGTHVAGIAAGDGVGSGPADGPGGDLADDAIGVAPGASIKAAKVLDSNGSGTEADVISGVEWCAAEADLISMSLGGSPTDGTDALSLTVNCAADPSFGGCGSAAVDENIVIVSAGNSGAEPGTVGTPGVAVNAITIGSFAEWSGDPGFSWQDDGVYLNPFSSRGPVSDGRTKPDIAAVGSRVLSAYIDQSNSYARASGTSMSAPQVSGIVALMLQANPSLGVADVDGLPHQKVRQILQNTAIDRGPPDSNGLPVKDNEYGWGLVDAYAAVAEALGDVQSYSPTAYPRYTEFGASVADSSEWLYPFDVASGDVGYPVAATITIDGFKRCYDPYNWGSCLAIYWHPDLDLVVEMQENNGSWSQVSADTSGSPEITKSECPGSGECGPLGRTELVHFIADAAGKYRLRVYPYSGEPNYGDGGNFDVEISMGPPESASGGNTAPQVAINDPADGSSFITGDTITFTGEASDTEDGDLSGSLSWTSDIDGALGTGSSVSTSTLSIGSHTITASVTDSGSKGGSDAITVAVTDESGNLPPTADFTFSASELSVSFTDTSTDSDGSIAGWAWDFGDGATATVQSPSHTYAADGTYSVSLTVTDDDGASDTVTQSVTVKQNAPPVASFDVEDGPDPCGGWLDNRCTFTDTSTDSDGTITSWSWDWGSGKVAGCGPCSGAGGSFLVDFPADGPNPTTVSLTVTDDANATNTMSVEVWLSAPANAAPTADFSFTTTDLTADFTDGSTDSDGTIASWAWDFGDGATSTAQNPNHTYSTGGSYTVSLTVTDDDGATGTTSQTVSVSDPANAAPTADFTFTTTDLTADFTDSSTDPDGTADLASWSWDFGDGATSTAQNPTHTYASGGDYLVTLTVTDDGGLTDQHSTTVSVTEPVTVIHLGDLDDASVSNGGRWDAQVTALVVDSSGNPVSGATVSGGWSNGANGNGNCDTDASGWCMMTKPNLKNNVSSVTFTVGTVGGTNMEYQSTANEDPDGESYGLNETSIDLQPGSSSTNEAPSASFTHACSDLACSFTDTSTDSDGTVSGWSWNFDDGNGSTAQHPSHSYSAGGTYTVTLTVTDDDGAASAPASKSITVSSGATSSISLTATGRKVQGVHTIDLSWTPADDGMVDVIRNGKVVATTGDDGGYVDSTGNKGGGEYNMQVCETESDGVCSNIVTVTF